MTAAAAPTLRDLDRSLPAYATCPDLRDKRVVITGGGSGIGSELVRAFAGQGARVWFLDSQFFCAQARRQ